MGIYAGGVSLILPDSWFGSVSQDLVTYVVTSTSSPSKVLLTFVLIQSLQSYVLMSMHKKMD